MAVDFIPTHKGVSRKLSCHKTLKRRVPGETLTLRQLERGRFIFDEEPINDSSRPSLGRGVRRDGKWDIRDVCRGHRGPVVCPLTDGNGVVEVTEVGDTDEWEGSQVGLGQPTDVPVGPVPVSHYSSTLQKEGYPQQLSSLLWDLLDHVRIHSLSSPQRVCLSTSGGPSDLSPSTIYRGHGVGLTIIWDRKRVPPLSHRGNPFPFPWWNHLYTKRRSRKMLGPSWLSFRRDDSVSDTPTASPFPGYVVTPVNPSPISTPCRTEGEDILNCPRDKNGRYTPTFNIYQRIGFTPKTPTSCFPTLKSHLVPTTHNRHLPDQRVRWWLDPPYTTTTSPFRMKLYRYLTRVIGTIDGTSSRFGVP